MVDGSGQKLRIPEHTGIRRNKNCRQVFLIFQGMRGAMMMNSLQFLHETGLTDRNLILFRDVRHGFYHRGLSDEVPTIEAMCSWQMKMLDQMGHVDQIYCLGSSSGAYAAMLFGHMLRADAVWAFAPPTDLASLEMTDYGKKCDDRYSDLLPRLEQSNGHTRYHVHFNKAQEHDLVAAERIAHCEGVELHPADGEGHLVIFHLHKLGVLPKMLPPFASV